MFLRLAYTWCFFWVQTKILALWAYPKRKSAYGARWSDGFRSLKNKPCWPSRPYKNSLRRLMAAMLYFSSRSSIAWDLPEISEEKATQDEAKPEVILIIIIFQEDLCCVENCQHCYSSYGQASPLMREFSVSWLSWYFVAKKHEIVAIFYQIWWTKM